MTNIKEKTDEISKAILFLKDDEQETRYVTAKFEDDKLVISFTNFNHVADKYVIDYRYKFNEKETQKFIKLLANDVPEFLQKLQEKFNTSSACADLIKYADENDISYKFLSGHEGGDLYRYELNDIYIDEDLLYDKNKNLVIPSFYEHPKNGVVKIYFRNGNLYMSISYKNNKKNGFTKCYSKETKKLLWEENYTDDLLDGITKKYYDNGNIEREETFIMGVKIGVDKYYNENGYLEKEEMWAKNKKNGFARKYYANGQVKNETFFKNDIQDGYTKEYYKSGKLLYEGKYKNNEAIGWGISYYENGNIQWKFPFGKIRGQETKYYENGNIEFTISRIGKFRNGKYTDYYEDGKLKCTGYYKNNELDGCCKQYYRNGNLEHENTYKNGKIHGVCKEYYSNGKIKKILHYKQGKLHGKAQRFYINGQLNYEYNFRNDLRNGYATIYERKTGDIKLKQYFKDGLLKDSYGCYGIKGVYGLGEMGSEHNKETLKTRKLQSGKIQKESKKKINQLKNKKVSTHFNIDLVNCSRDIKFLTDKIIANKDLNFSMCIYGDPGTGKSAYARYLADKLGIDVVCRTAADILDQYVGNSEKLIAEAFEEAEKKKAMLIIDEVDSFLRSRGLAQRNWEVTIVNQMLTCMEKFNYPFICTTNFIDSLDQASLRRFTFKFKFGFLKPNQIEDAFNYVFNTKPSEEILKMKGLTVSDFVNIKKECDILEITDINEIAKMLDETVSLKESKDLSTNVGFN